MPETALTSFTVCDAYRYLAGQALFMRSQSRSRSKYFLQTDTITVLNWYFNL